MKKRVLAWVLLIGFVALLANILIFQKELLISFGIYLVIVAIYYIYFYRKR